MERLARLIPVRTYGRFRHLRPAQSQIPCRRNLLDLASVEQIAPVISVASWVKSLPSM
jgi:hypothetical protein